jgi:hypothetical protein
MVYLESRGVIHRDVACRNFLIDSANRVKVRTYFSISDEIID